MTASTNPHPMSTNPHAMSENPHHEALNRAVALGDRGDEHAARAILDTLAPHVPLEVETERCALDIRDRQDCNDVVERLDVVLANANSEDVVRARALHIRGRALMQCGDSVAAIASLLDSIEAYQTCDRATRCAQVYDTLGAILDSEGRLEPASAYFAMSLAMKFLHGDRLGAAMTLGSIGRMQLKMGRATAARTCFEMDLELAKELDDQRGQARMWNDIARTYLLEGEPNKALDALGACFAVTDSLPLEEIKLYAQKDLALAHASLSTTDGDEHAQAALSAVSRARDLLASRHDAFAGALIDHAEGKVLERRDPKRAQALYQSAIDTLARRGVPDAEIDVLLDLAALQSKRSHAALARRSLERALNLAREQTLDRHLPRIYECMASLAITPGAQHESGLTIHDALDDGLTVRGYAHMAKLGGGAFGTVYRALDLARHRVVAMKLLNLEGVYDPKARAVLESSIRVELEAASRVRHPGIAHVYAIGTDERGRLYVVQDYVRGPSLRDVMNHDAQTDVATVCATLRDLAFSLEALHDAGVVHRDVKPQNVILVPPASRPVLIDLGVAYTPHAAENFGRDAIVGSLAYMAPEQAAGKAVGARADVYSLGAIAYEWLSGMVPVHLDGTDVAQFPRQLARKRPAPLQELRATLPSALIALVHDMLAKSARRRPHARDVAIALDDIVRVLLPA